MAVYDSENIVVAGSGQIRVAPPGTSFPSTFVSPTWDPAFVELGFTDTKGVVGNDQRTIADVNVWQSFYPALKIITERKFDFSFNLSEWTKDTFGLAFGGGSWTTAAGVAKYTPPDPGTIDVRTLVIDWQSQGFNFRWGIFKGLVDSNVQTTLTRSGEALLPVQFGVLGSAGTPPWVVYTDNPRFLTTAPTAWAGTTLYATNTQVTLGAGVVKATTGGTSGATAPTLPGGVGGTVTDGTVTWFRTA